MANALVHNPQARKLTDAGTARTVRENDLEDNTVVRDGQEITVYSRQVPADKIYAWGAGTNDRQVGRESFMYFDLRADGNGSATADDVITGDLVAVITDSEQRDVHARYELGDLTSLSDAASSDRVDRPMQPVVVPVAREDQHLELRIIADSNSDGAQIDNGGAQATEVRVFFTDIPV